MYTRGKKSTHKGKIKHGESYTKTSTDGGVYTWRSVYMEEYTHGGMYYTWRSVHTRERLNTKKNTQRKEYTLKKIYAGESECEGRRVHTVECIHGEEPTRGKHTQKSTYGGEHTQRSVHTGRAQMGRVYTKESTHGGVLSTQRRKCTHPGVHTEESTHERVYIQGEYTEEYTRGERTRSTHGDLEEYTQRNTYGGSKHGESTYDMEEYSFVNTPSTPSCEVSFISSSIELQ